MSRYDTLQTEQDIILLCALQVFELGKDDFCYHFTEFMKDLTVKCNWHSHMNMCFKHLWNGQPRTDANCQMCITGQTCPSMSLDPDTLSVLLCRLHPWINNYNDMILFLLQSNMDIKFIGSGPAAKALIYYIIDYITKSDIQIHAGVQTLQVALNSNANKFGTNPTVVELHRDQSLVTKCMNLLMGKQEISHQQVMSYLVGDGNTYTSHCFQSFCFYEVL